MRKIIKQIDYRFNFILQTPFLTTIEDLATINIGSIDKATAVQPLSHLPYISESSIKGKMRYCAHLLGYSDEVIKRYFGSEEAKYGPCIINVCSVRAINNANISPQRHFFIKSEVSIDRIDGSANPRFFLVSAPQIEFECRLKINLYDDDITDEEVLKFMNSILLMLEDNYIGAGGTRGFGKIKVTKREYQKTDLANKDITVTINQLKDEIIYLRFKKHSSPYIQSTTIATLFVYALAEMKQEALISEVLNGDALRVSSAMPCININGSRIHHFALPKYYVKGIKTSDNKKRFFEIKYISEALLIDFLKDPNNIAKWCQRLDDYRIIEGRFLLTKAEAQGIPNNMKLVKAIDTMHTAIDPNTSSYKEGMLFSTTEYFFSEYLEMFFFIRHKLGDINPIMQRIKQLGIGRDKSVGLGHFDYEVLPNHFEFINNPNSPTRYLSLSLIHPSEEERELLKRGKSTYTVLARKGKRENNSYTGTDDFRVEKDKIYMLKEGSVFDFEIKGSSPVVYPTNEEGYEIRDFGYSYLIGF